MARTDRTKRIAASIANAVGLPGAAETLAALPASALGSLLLAVHRSRAGAVTAPRIRAAAGERLFRPSTVEGRIFHRFDAVAFEAARGFEAVDVAPVAPFGASSRGRLTNARLCKSLRTRNKPAADRSGRPRHAL